MYIKIEGNKAEVIEHIDKDKPKILCIMERIEDELEGFLKYKHMSEKHERYKIPSMQEFQHMLLAWDDFFSELCPMLTTEEELELRKFLKSWYQSEPAKQVTSTM